MLGIDPGNPSALKDILDWDLDARFAVGIKAIEVKIQTAQRFWQAACLSAPKLEKISLSDTLRSIGSFSGRYHYRYFAHEIPCDIDYQLCHPGAGNAAGRGLYPYLRRVLMEQDFLNRLSPALCIRILNAYCPDYRGLLIKLYEPVATNAIGLALVGGDVRGLNISPQERN